MQRTAQGTGGMLTSAEAMAAVLPVTTASTMLVLTSGVALGWMDTARDPTGQLPQRKPATAMEQMIAATSPLPSTESGSMVHQHLAQTSPWDFLQRVSMAMLRMTALLAAEAGYLPPLAYQEPAMPPARQDLQPMTSSQKALRRETREVPG